MRTRTAALIAAIATALLLTGCAGDSATESSAPIQGDAGISVEGGAPEMAPDMMTGEKAAVPGATTTSVPTDRQVIKTAYVTMQVTDVAKATSDVHLLVRQSNGLISNEDAQTNGESSYANITAQVPATGLDAFIAAVSDLGTVQTVSISAQDVTTQVVDLDARIKALQASIDRMTQLMAQASRIEDLLAIETQLSMRQAELDSLKAQRTYLGDQVAMSTVTVSLTPVSEITTVDAPGFLTGLEAGWAAFVSLIMVGVTAVGFLLPFMIVLAIILVPVVLVIVRQSHRHRRRPDAGSVAAPAAPPAEPPVS